MIQKINNADEESIPTNDSDDLFIFDITIENFKFIDDTETNNSQDLDTDFIWEDEEQ